MRDMIDTEIAKLESAMRSARQRMDKLEEQFEFPRDCCPMCACGPEWLQLANKRERQAVWLRVLYRKRSNVDGVRRLEFDFGRMKLDELERNGCADSNE